MRKVDRVWALTATPPQIHRKGSSRRHRRLSFSALPTPSRVAKSHKVIRIRTSMGGGTLFRGRRRHTPSRGVSPTLSSFGSTPSRPPFHYPSSIFSDALRGTPTFQRPAERDDYFPTSAPLRAGGGRGNIFSPGTLS